jgi:hypothetical protein
MTEEEKSAEEIERELRLTRKFRPEEALARMAGPGAMTGASPVSRVVQAETEIGNWLRDNLDDPAGALEVQLQRHLKGSPALLGGLDQPLAVLAEYLRRIVDTEELLKEVVREADVEWGRRMDERPHFEREGSAASPEDPYTVDGVGHVLNDALAKLLSA